MGWCNVFCFRILYLLLYIQMDKSLILWLFPLDGPSDKTIQTVELNPVKPCVFVCYSLGKIAKTIDFGWNHQKLELKKIYYFDCATATGYRLLIYRAN